jgi:hypothetical protein
MRLLPDGSIEFDAAELPSVLAAQARMKSGATKAPAARKVVEEEQEEEQEESQEADEPNWEGLMEDLATKPLPLAALRVVKQRGTLTMPQMVEALGVESAFSVSGVITGVTRSSAKHGYASGDLIISQRGRDRVIIYSAGPALINAPELPE